MDCGHGHAVVLTRGDLSMDRGFVVLANLRPDSWMKQILMWDVLNFRRYVQKAALTLLKTHF